MKKTLLLIVAALLAGQVLAQNPKRPDPGAVKATNEAINKQIKQMMQASEAQMNRYWTKSTLTLPQLAQKVAWATKSMAGVHGQYQMLAQTSEGRGIYTGEMRFQSPALFKLNWVRLEADPRNGIFVGDGSKRHSLYDGTLMPDQAVTQPFKGTTTDPAQLVARFSNEFSRFLFQGAIEGKDPWVPLLTAWGKGAGGYATKVEQRKITLANKTYLSYRVKCVRNAAAAKKLGKSELEVVFDGTRFLPITVRETRVDLNGKEWRIQWAGKYLFNQKFKKTDFQMGTASKASP